MFNDYCFFKNITFKVKTYVVTFLGNLIKRIIWSNWVTPYRIFKVPLYTVRRLVVGSKIEEDSSGSNSKQFLLLVSAQDTNHRGKYHRTAGLDFNKQENMLLFGCPLNPNQSNRRPAVQCSLGLPNKISSETNNSKKCLKFSNFF